MKHLIKILVGTFLAGACSTRINNYAPFADHAVKAKPVLTILTYNLQNVRESTSPEKLHRVATVIREAASGCPDLVVVQEIQSNAVLQKLNKFELAGCAYGFSAVSKPNMSGLRSGLLSKYKLDAVGNNNDEEFGVLRFDLVLPTQTVRVYETMLTQSSPMDAYTFNTLRETFTADRKRATIILGTLQIPKAAGFDKDKLLDFRKAFFISDDLIHGSTLNQGTVFDTDTEEWMFSDKILTSRNAFSQVNCRVEKSQGLQSNSAGQPLAYPEGKAAGSLLLGVAPGVSSHFPVLCRMEY